MRHAQLVIGFRAHTCRVQPGERATGSAVGRRTVALRMRSRGCRAAQAGRPWRRRKMPAPMMTAEEMVLSVMVVSFSRLVMRMDQAAGAFSWRRQHRRMSTASIAFMLATVSFSPISSGVPESTVSEGIGLLAVLVDGCDGDLLAPASGKIAAVVQHEPGRRIGRRIKGNGDFHARPRSEHRTFCVRASWVGRKASCRPSGNASSPARQPVRAEGGIPLHQGDRPAARRRTGSERCLRRSSRRRRSRPRRYPPTHSGSSR